MAMRITKFNIKPNLAKLKKSNNYSLVKKSNSNAFNSKQTEINISSDTNSTNSDKNNDALKLVSTEKITETLILSPSFNKTVIINRSHDELKLNISSHIEIRLNSSEQDIDKTMEYRPPAHKQPQMLTVTEEPKIDQIVVSSYIDLITMISNDVTTDSHHLPSNHISSNPFLTTITSTENKPVDNICKSLNNQSIECNMQPLSHEKYVTSNSLESINVSNSMNLKIESASKRNSNCSDKTSIGKEIVLTKDASFANEKKAIKITALKKAAPTTSSTKKITNKSSSSTNKHSRPKINKHLQLKLDDNGDIIVVESSTILERTKDKPDLENLALVIDETTNNFSRYGLKNVHHPHWTNGETEMFYRALAVTGTDFSLMKDLMSDRSRIELKNKFTKEDRLNSKKVTETLSRIDYKNIYQFKKDYEINELKRARPKEEGVGDKFAKIRKTDHSGNEGVATISRKGSDQIKM